MRHGVPYTNWSRHLANTVRDALDGDTIVCHSIPMVDRGERALKQTYPDKKLIFVLEEYQMKTVIYSCGGDMTSGELLLMVENDEDVLVDLWFPECGRVNGMDMIPLTEREIIAKLPELKGKTLVTVSEIVIVMFLREIRLGNIQSDEFELWCNGDRIEIGVAGAMIDPWDGGFFEEGFDLRFN